MSVNCEHCQMPLDALGVCQFCDAPPDGMASCEYCNVILPFIYARHYQTGELLHVYPGDIAHQPSCPFNHPLPEQCPF